MNLIRFAVLLLSSVASTRAGTFSGTVRNSEGAVISNAHVVIHWDPSGSNYLKDNLGIKQDVEATTDSSGHFSLELPPGFYDVFVTAMAFTPHCDKVCLKEKETYDVKLKVSPVTSKELD
jgi:carboxypeptidase family protein